MLKGKINDDIKTALKSGDANKRLVLSLLQSAIKNKELQKRAKSGKEEELNDDEVLDVIASEVKKRKESIESYEKAGREELAQKERDELGVLMQYMPEQMSEEEIRTEAKKAIAETGAKEIKEMGKVLGALMPKMKGRADGQTVSRITKEEIEKFK
ncbi:MAG: GatB/YqeY domain-containing protein [Candidatus Yanofskybacteria bacterium]|nr:GatB/YqeY domain-containing protein [Candidatus Yanofskybacteria bacterium]